MALEFDDLIQGLGKRVTAAENRKNLLFCIHLFTY